MTVSRLIEILQGMPPWANVTLMMEDDYDFQVERNVEAVEYFDAFREVSLMDGFVAKDVEQSNGRKVIR